MRFDDLTVQGAKNNVGETFKLAMDDGQSLNLVLEGVSELPTGPSESAPTGFSLQLRGPAEPLLEQGSYGFTHGEMEPQPVFIVPISSDDTGTIYEAVFTRL